MNAGAVIRRTRRRAGLSLRELAEHADTSHSTIAAYESGRVVPRVDTLERLLRAAGFASDIAISGRPDAAPADRLRKGRELVEVLELAAKFPSSHERNMSYPRFADGGGA